MVWDGEMQALVAGVGVVLAAATVAGQSLRLKHWDERGREAVGNLNQRVFSWWVMTGVVALAVVAGVVGSAVLFGFISFLAMREFITMTPTKRADHRSLFLAFFLVIPVQYYLVSVSWYGLFTIFIPVYAFLLIPIISSVAADNERFLERTSEIQWAMMVCAYLVSYAPALLLLKLPHYEGENAKLFVFFVIVVEASDVLQYTWGKLLGRHPIAPRISPNKTWEGFILGVACATLLGTALWWATPFEAWESLLMSLAITLMGFFGGLTMSAIKRDRGVKDYGTLLPGHGGIMDRIDSLSFAAPVFFHLTRYFFG